MHRFFLLLFLPFLLMGEQLSLKDNLKYTEEGDYIVTRQGKNYTLLHVHTLSDESVILEEITVPERKVKRRQDWKKWVKNEAPKSSAWVMYEVGLSDGRILDFYSVTKKGWIQVQPEESFFSTLLNLKFDKVADEDRRKMAHPDQPLWQPRLVVDGRVIRGAKFNAWTTRWPKDSTPLSGKKLEIYLPEKHERYPSYFPYWIDVSTAAPGSRVRIVDSGRGLKSPQTTFPRLPPEMVSVEHLRSGDLVITLKGSIQYASYELIAFDLDNEVSPITSLTPEQSRSEKGTLLRVPSHELTGKLTKGHRYRLIAKPHGFDILAVESPQLFVVE